MPNPRSNVQALRRAGRGALLLVFSGLMLLDGALAAGGEEVPKEYQIKAAFLYNFAKYVEWPARNFPAAGSPIVIGVYCADRFGSVLEKIVQGRKIHEREIAIKMLKTAAESKAAQVVYVCTEQAALGGPVLKALKESAVLTVTNLNDSGAPGGMIVFVLEGDKVRFNINMDEARRAGLKISDQLQKLAITVIRTP